MKQKHGDQTGLDTLVVRAVTDEYEVLKVLVFKLTRWILRLGTTIARLKLKGIGGGLLPTVEHVV